MRILSSLALMAVVMVASSYSSHASSCQAFFSQCSARCVNNPKGETQAKCTADHCTPKLNACRKSGCWTEGKNYGGGTTCSLAKG